ncbi:MAG: lysine--tRNA ligase [Candidatus Pacebacteria bacterium]|nr:lysine--tRNA ligase [Candidatus Paceibacterota bacterium]
MASLDELRQSRIEKMKRLTAFGMEAFPAHVPRDYPLDVVRDQFTALESSNESRSISGRVMAIRGQGAILFVVLDDGTAKFQTVFKKDSMDEKLFDLFVDTADVGDFISTTGTFFTTERGEFSMLVSDWRMATKSLLPLPEKWHGISDPDERFRKRYLDIVMTPELREMFNKKGEFWKATRSFMLDHGFLEVETPTLELTTGGAEANPFKTHHKDFDVSVYLRISIGELWQKRLMAAGFPKTFEIGRAYRNEGTSPEHLQEFTNMEFYWAYADYRDGMKLCQQLYQHIAQNVFGTLEFTTRGHTFNLGGEWPVVDYCNEIKKQTGIDVLTANEEEMKSKLDSLKVKYEGGNRERLTDTLWKYCRKNIAGPAFLVHHPKLVSPLAKESVERPGTVERYQIILAGSEVGNGFSELNDPLDQRERFELQQKLIEEGDEEAMQPEWEFVEMLEHGMPPTCGFGFGERFFAFLVDKPIRETQLFPLMRPKGHEAAKKETFVSTIVLNKGGGMLPWQEMNTVSHLSAAFAVRKDKNQLLTRDTIATKDKKNIKLNIKNAIIIKTANSSDEIFNLGLKGQEEGFDVQYFTREMLETTNDKKIIEATLGKNASDVEYLGVLVHGTKKKVDELTKDFERYS